MSPGTRNFPANNNNKEGTGVKRKGAAKGSFAAAGSCVAKKAKHNHNNHNNNNNNSRKNGKNFAARRRQLSQNNIANMEQIDDAEAGDTSMEQHEDDVIGGSVDTTPSESTSTTTTELDRALQNLACYHPTNTESTRLEALEYLETILSQNTKPWERAALVTFGSFRLGVHRSTSDIDVLAVAPGYSSSRHDFFMKLVQILEADPQVEQVHPILQAYTPVIKFILHGIHIDMLCAQVAETNKLVEFHRKQRKIMASKSNPSSGQPQQQQQQVITPVPRRMEYEITDGDLVDLDEAGVRSINGARVSQILLQMVPNLATFRTALKAVKEWAIQAGIYSNVLGFLGGINWAILVAWICIRYPKHSNDKLLELFFQTFATWKWPRPVLLTPIQNTPPARTLPLPCWNPVENPRDGLHICPIITPAYPSMNSSYNVGMPQLRRMQNEMILACNHLKEHHGDYSALFAPSDFFTRHEHYLQISIRATNRQDFVEWFRLVESKLRLLICSIEASPQVHAWPFAKFFSDSTTTTSTDNESFFFLALRFVPGLDEIQLAPLVTDFLQKINAWENRKAGMDVSMKHIMRADLPPFVLQPATPAGQPETPSIESSDIPEKLEEGCQSQVVAEPQQGTNDSEPDLGEETKISVESTTKSSGAN